MNVRPTRENVKYIGRAFEYDGNAILGFSGSGIEFVTGDETMELRHYASREDLEEGAFQIMEPVGEPFIAFDQIDFALVPGMAFDAAGHRLGRGKGYYDRFLSTHPDIYKIGVCFPFQRVAEVPSEAHDVVMDEVIS